MFYYHWLTYVWCFAQCYTIQNKLLSGSWILYKYRKAINNALEKQFSVGSNTPQSLQWLGILRQFLSPAEPSSHHTGYYLCCKFAGEFWSCQPLTLQSDHALPEETWICLVRVSSVMIVSLISYRCVRNRKALSYFRIFFLSLNLVWR